VTQRILVDSGALVALYDRRDAHHPAANAVFRPLHAPLRCCQPVLTETAWILRRVPGSTPWLAEMLRRGVLHLDFDLAAEHAAVFGLMARYAEVPMSLADACLVRMSELDPRAKVFTFDHDFAVYRRGGRGRIPTVGLG
jgi:predicted nucleic acid-binding protein